MFTCSHRPCPAGPVTAPSAPVAAPVTAPPTLVISQASPTPYVIVSPPSGIGYSFLAGSATSDPLKFIMTLDFGVSSHFVDSNLIGDIEPRTKDIVKFYPPELIVVTGHSTLRGVSMVILAVRVTDAQGFFHDMLLPTMTVPCPGPGRHLFQEVRRRLKG